MGMDFEKGTTGPIAMTIGPHVPATTALCASVEAERVALANRLLSDGPNAATGDAVAGKLLR
jgi:hypothetical protein